jgi:hypothetical protein
MEKEMREREIKRGAREINFFLFLPFETLQCSMLHPEARSEGQGCRKKLLVLLKNSLPCLHNLC